MRFASLLAVTLVSIVACSHAQPAPPPVPTQVMEQPAPAPAPEPVAEPAPVPAKLAAVSVYFDFDSAELVPAARDALQSLADLAQRGYAQSIRIQGNCDERGTREYNLALGQRRADAAKKYLTGLGVSANRILAISYGKERPRATGHDEESWKENRRDDVVPVSGQSSNVVSQASP